MHANANGFFVINYNTFTEIKYIDFHTPTSMSDIYFTFACLGNVILLKYLNMYIVYLFLYTSFQDTVNIIKQNYNENYPAFEYL